MIEIFIAGMPIKKSDIAVDAKTEMSAGKLKPLAGPVELSFSAVFPIPKGWSKKRLAAHYQMPEFTLEKPDMAKLIKTLSKALSGICYSDEAHIARCVGEKVYGEKPGVTVFVVECVRIYK